MLNVPSINPSISIYPPAIRVIDVRFTVIRLVSASISSRLIIIFSLRLSVYPCKSLHISTAFCSSQTSSACLHQRFFCLIRSVNPRSINGSTPLLFSSSSFSFFSACMITSRTFCILSSRAELICAQSIISSARYLL